MSGASSLLQTPGATAVLALTLAFSVVGLLWWPNLIERCVLRPYWLVRRGQWHTLLTSGLVHADFGHLLLNMLTFWFFAFQLERAIGTARFLVLYVLALVASDLNTYLKHRNEPEYGSLGASGAIAAVLFASIVYFPGQSLFIIPIPVPIPAPLFAVGYVAFSWYSARQARGRVNHDAHLGGALFGLLFVALTDPAAFGGLARMLG
ncbi:MAG: rhomboid family intramembrane serine protease [Steroidobacteraceae bacterium]|jgi:membrane associated rhomboid family serine protease|nr:rhomboid family intramembrane serine protease [Steroidobacteraceae bacterium]